MPVTTTVIDNVTAPPFATLQQVLDTHGPYGAGSHNLLTFTTNGAFLLPAGTYQVNGTYGVIVAVHGAIPHQAGFSIGYNDPGGIILYSGDVYEQRIAQVNVLRNSALAPAWVATEVEDISQILQLVQYAPYLGAGMQIALHVEPNWSVDLFYQCVL
jgi:hypothetical protein